MSGEKILSQRDLKVWQKAMDTAMAVFNLTKTFPAEERYSMTNQVRRSSRSVPANIAEAWRKRRYAPAFVSKLNDAEGEAAETQTHIELARRCGYISDDQASELDRAYEEIISILATMANHPEKWCLDLRRLPISHSDGWRIIRKSGVFDLRRLPVSHSDGWRIIRESDVFDPSLIVSRSQESTVSRSQGPTVSRS